MTIDNSKVDPMWRMFEKGQRKGNAVALESAVDNLIHMASQKTAGQMRSDNRSDLPFELLDMVKWQIICEACYLVLDERYDSVKALFEEERSNN